MKHQILRIFALGALISSALVLTGCPGKSEGPGAEVKIAANLPLTGDLATYGTAVRDGANMAVEEIKADSKNPKLSFDWQDNASDPKQAGTVLQRQLLDNPNIYVSGVKPQTMAIRDKVNEKGLPHFEWIFDANINPGGTRNAFRTWVSYKIEPPVYLNYAAERQAKRVAIVYVQLPHTVEEFDTLVIPGLKKQGANVVYVEPFAFGTKDFKTIAVKIQASKPDLIILNGFQNDLVSLVRAMRPLNLISDGNTIATYDMLDAATILGQDELEGIRLVAPLFVTQPDRTNVKDWRDRFRAKYSKEPLYTHAFAYDMAMIIEDAAKRVGANPDSAKWIDALRATNIEGVTGPLKFDDKGDLITPLEVGVFRGGHPVPETAPKR